MQQSVCNLKTQVQAKDPERAETQAAIDKFHQAGKKIKVVDQKASAHDWAQKVPQKAMAVKASNKCQVMEKRKKPTTVKDLLKKHGKEGQVKG